MPIDTSIYEMLGQGVTPIANPVQMQMQQAQLKHLAAQTSLAQSQDQEQQAKTQGVLTQQKNMKAIADALKDVSDPDERKARLYKLGTPEAFAMHHKMVQDELGTEKAQRESAIANGLLQKQKMDQIASKTAGLLALPPEQRAAAWGQFVTDAKEIDPEKAANLPAQYPGDATVNSMHEMAQSEQQRLQVQQQLQLKAHQDATLAETHRHNLESEKTARIAANKPAASVVLQQMGQLPSNFDPTAALHDPGLEGQADAIARRDQKIQQPTTRTPYANQVNARAAYLGKTKYGFDNGLPGDTEIEDKKRAVIEFGPSGKTGQTIMNTSTAVGHLDMLSQLGTALNNGDNQSVNKLSNLIKTWNGGASPTNFNGLKQLAMTEVLKAAKGSGVINEEEQKDMKKNISDASSGAQLAGIVDVYIKTMGSRIESMLPNYRLAAPGRSITEKLTPEATKAFQRLGLNLGPVAAQNTSGASGSSPAVAQTPSYAGVTMPKAKYDGLSAAAKKAFIGGGGKVGQ